MLRSHDIDAGVGEVPGEYCPGSSSVHARGRKKLAGTAQRVLRGAWLFSAVAIVDDAAVLRPVLTEVHRHLRLPFSLTTVGSIRQGSPGLSAERLEESVLAAYGQRFKLGPA